MEQLMAYTGEMMQARIPDRPEIIFFRAVERTLLLIHHDYPDFVSENHVRLVSRIPYNLPQLRNIITSAVPSTMGDLPDPYHDVRANELHVIENIFSNPVVRGDFATPLEKAGIREIVDELLRSTSTSNEQHHNDINFIIDAVSDKDDNGQLIQYLCVYIATQAIAAATTRGTPSEMFDSEGVHYNLILSLTRNTSFRSRYDFIEAMFNQLRFPSSHMYWFHRTVMEMMHPLNNHTVDPIALNVKEQISRVLLERLTVDRPYPWGILITAIQLYKAMEYEFFELPFIKATYSMWSEMPAIIGVKQRQPYLLS
jgi:CCR4-NOT transcription complex subunit 1